MLKMFTWNKRSDEFCFRILIINIILLENIFVAVRFWTTFSCMSKSVPLKIATG